MGPFKCGFFSNGKYYVIHSWLNLQIEKNCIWGVDFDYAEGLRP